MAPDLSPTTRRVTIDSLLLSFLDNHPENPTSTTYQINHPPSSASSSATPSSGIPALPPVVLGGGGGGSGTQAGFLPPIVAPGPYYPSGGAGSPGYSPYYGYAAYASPSVPAYDVTGRAPLANADANRPLTTTTTPTAPVKGKPGRKRKSDASDPTTSATPTTNTTSTPSAAKRPRKSNFSSSGSFYLDVTSITLPGEATTSVPVHDMCDTVRRRIRDALGRDGVTQASFLRAIAATYPDGRKIQNKQLNDFLSKKGALAGNRSCIYYAAYVFFEKVRIRDGAEKDKDRLVVEKKWPRGVDTVRDISYVWGSVDRAPYVDKYGQVQQGPPRRT